MVLRNDIQFAPSLLSKSQQISIKASLDVPDTDHDEQHDDNVGYGGKSTANEGGLRSSRRARLEQPPIGWPQQYHTGDLYKHEQAQVLRLRSQQKTTMNHSFMQERWNDQFWGPVTATLDWCEVSIPK